MPVTAGVNLRVGGGTAVGLSIAVGTGVSMGVRVGEESAAMVASTPAWMVAWMSTVGVDVGVPTTQAARTIGVAKSRKRPARLAKSFLLAI